MINRFSNLSCLFIFLLGIVLATVPAVAKSLATQDLEKAIASNSENHLAFLQILSQATKAGEEAVQALVSRRLTDLGCKVETLRISPSEIKLKHEFAKLGEIAAEPRISVVGRYPGEGNGRSLLIFAHPDPPPQQGLEKWTFDPFQGKIEGGKVYGWGVADDLAGVAIMIEALAAIKDAGLEPRGEVILCSTPAKRNAQGVIALLDRGYAADAALYLHPAESGAGMKEIKGIASGMLQFQIRIIGRQPETTEPGHTVFAHRAINPIDKAITVIQALKDLDQRRGERIHHPGLDQAIGRSTNILIGSLQAGDKGALTRVPADCTFGVSLTFPPEEKLLEVKNEVNECLAEAAHSDAWLQEHPPEIQWIFGTQGVEVPVKHSFYQTVSHAILEVTGEQPFVNPLHSASDIRNPILFSGIPTLGLGPLAGNLAQNGLADEWVDAADFIRAVQITARVILDWGQETPKEEN